MTLLLRAKHALGQHFLRDESLLERMLDETSLNAGDNAAEIGPGLGDMTRVMARRAGRVLALEIDKDLVPVLRTQFMLDKHVDVVEGDVMTADLPQLLSPLGDFHVISNLPYYLTTPILTLPLQPPPPIKSICVTGANRGRPCAGTAFQQGIRAVVAAGAVPHLQLARRDEPAAQAVYPAAPCG